MHSFLKVKEPMLLTIYRSITKILEKSFKNIYEEAKQRENYRKKSPPDGVRKQLYGDTVHSLLLLILISIYKLVFLYFFQLFLSKSFWFNS